MKILQQIVQPTLLLDAKRCKVNIERMCQKMHDAKVRFRPHFKTHQSLEIGSWFRDFEVKQITVSSVRMAQYFASDGWEDIMIAFPVNLLEVSRINTLAEKVHLQLIAEDPDLIRKLDVRLRSPVDMLLKMDIGTHRTGLDPADRDRVDACAQAIRNSRFLTWKGFVAHAGHTYRCIRDVSAMRAIYAAASDALLTLKDQYRRAGDAVDISFGDTPGASLLDDIGWIDEMRPGNFVFYDTMQEQIGSCTLDEIAVAMACPVVSVHPERHEYVVYGGGIHFSKDFLSVQKDVPSFGTVVDYDKDHWIGSHVSGSVRSLSQEHGVVTIGSEKPCQINPGDVSVVLPVHSCMTAQCMGGYMDISSGKRIDHFAASKTYTEN